MSQYKTGTATVTNGSATVTGTNTLWLANVTAGDSFTIASTGVMYDVASVDSDTQVTLSVAYAGVTASGAVYAIGTGFTVPDSFPEMSQGDIETATIFTRGMRKIQSKFSGIAINTTAEIGQAVSDKADKATTYTETEVDNLLDDKADKATTYTETEVDGLLNTKADQANTYTETEVDELTGSLAYPNTTLASSSDIPESVEPAIAAYPHIQGFRTGTGTALTFAQAVEEAAERGARLLTIQELEAGVAAGTGFVYDAEITWTSSPAGVGLVYGNLGEGDGTRVVLNTNTDTAAGGYAVSVIGQRQWTDTRYAAIAGQTFTGDIAAPKITASTGILFGTDTAAANTLDDYEEGTWTPVIDGGDKAYTALRSASYVKTGSLVYVQCFLFDFTGGDGTAFEISGMPFSVATDGFSTGSIDYGSGNVLTNPHVRSQGGTDVVKLRKEVNDVIIQTDIGGFLMFSITYEAG